MRSDGAQRHKPSTVRRRHITAAVIAQRACLTGSLAHYGLVEDELWPMAVTQRHECGRTTLRVYDAQCVRRSKFLATHACRDCKLTSENCSQFCGCSFVRPTHLRRRTGEVLTCFSRLCASPICASTSVVDGQLGQYLSSVASPTLLSGRGEPSTQ